MNKIGNFGFNALHSSLHTEGYFYDNHHDDGDFIKTIPAAKTWVLKSSVRPNQGQIIGLNLHLFQTMDF